MGAKPIRFESGGTSAVVEGRLEAGATERYLIGAVAGNALSVDVSAPDGEVTLGIQGVDGTVLLSEQAGVTSWYGELPQTHGYFISIVSVGQAATDYMMAVVIQPAPLPDTELPPGEELPEPAIEELVTPVPGCMREPAA